MKNILITLITLFALSFQVNAQTVCPIPFDDEKNAFVYSEVVHLQGVSQNELFDRSLNWIDRNFVNSRIRMNQNAKAKGEVELDGITRVYNTDKKGNKTLDAIVKYKYFIQFREGRYRYEITNFHVDRGYRWPIEKWLDESEYSPGENNHRFAQVDEHIRQLIESMKSEMSSPFVETEEDW